MRSQFHLLLLLAVWAFAGCRFAGHNTTEAEKPIALEPSENGAARVFIEVRTVDGRPIQGATITIGNRTVRTDGGGRAKPEMPGGEYVLRADADGYAASMRPVAVQGGRTNVFSLILVPMKTIALASLMKAQTIKEPGIELEIPANAFEDTNGNVAKSGLLELHNLDLDRELQAMPGDFRGTMGGLTVPIESYGAVSIDIRDPATHKLLRIRKGASIQARLRVKGKPGQPKAWSMNESTGLWTYEGEVRLVRAGNETLDEISIPHLSWWNIDAPISEKSSIWVQSFVDQDGNYLFTPQLAARGIDYYGISFPYDYYSKPAQRAPGRCVDVKRGSRIELTADFVDDGSLYEVRTEVQSKDRPASCQASLNDGIVIPRLTLNRVAVTCVRGRLSVKGLSSGGKIELYAETSAGRTDGRFDRPLFTGTASSGGSFCIDSVPVNRQSWLFVFNAPERRLEECDRESYGAFPIRAEKWTPGASCTTNSAACVDAGTLSGTLSYSRCSGDDGVDLRAAR